MHGPHEVVSNVGQVHRGVCRIFGQTIIIVIDGVDECNSQSLAEFLAFFKDISKGTKRLKVFLSSRSGEGIEGTFCDAAQMNLHTDRERDGIVVDHRVSYHLGGLTEPTRSLVVKHLHDVADGSRIWIKLTVDLIRKRRISVYGPMKSFLSFMPL